MAEKNNILKGTKVLSITDGNSRTWNFASEVESSVQSLKLRYYVWIARLFILASVLSLGFFASSWLVLFKLAPRITVEPFLIINQDSSKDMVRYESIRMDMASKKKLMELFIRQYVIIRNTIINDEIEMRSRWHEGGMVNFLSSWGVFEDFQAFAYQKNWDNMQRINVVREVEIISVGKVGGEKSAIWKVDFKTYDLSESSRNSATKALVLKTRYWTASITAHFFMERQFIGMRLINPLGFTVVRYSQTEVEL